MPTRRTFLKSGAAVIAGGLAGDAAIWEPNHPRVVRVEVVLQRLPEVWNGLRIVQLSDFHYDPYFSVHPIKKAVEITQGLQPDLIVLTGDFITYTSFSKRVISREQQTINVQMCSKVLGGLHSRLGVFAVIGNHDRMFGADVVINALTANSIRVLRNSSYSLQQNGARLWLAGVDDVLEGNPDLEKSLRGISGKEVVILLAHEPDFFINAANSGIDLQLSGHSHGGQIRVPFMGAPYLPVLGKKFPKGMYQIGDTKLYTNIGLGTIIVPLRFDCPPEVTLFTLRSSA